MTIGGLLWIYVPEILEDKQLGFVSSFHYLNGVVISIISEPMFKYLRPEGTFMVFSIITFLVFIFILIFVKETKGLTDR